MPKVEKQTKRFPTHPLQVRAIQNGATQFRVPVEPQLPIMNLSTRGDAIIATSPDTGKGYYITPPFAPGDIVWFAETWRFIAGGSKDILGNEYAGSIEYADGNTQFVPVEKLLGTMLIRDLPTDWRSPATMPEWAARLRRQVVSVRCERLHMSHNDWCKWFAPNIRQQENALASFVGHSRMHEMSSDFWNTIHPDYQWDSNPWTFVCEIKETG